MHQVMEIIRKKPPVFLVISVGYAHGVGMVKWGIPSDSLRASAWPPEAFLYFAGAMIGVYFLDGAEAFFAITPSPFRSIVFMTGFAVVSFFVVTSSASFIGSGLVLSLYLSLLLWQIGELQVTGSLASWYRMAAGVPSTAGQRWVLIALGAIFFIETYLFVR